MNKLIVFYSLEGNTKRAAEEMAEAAGTGVELLQIEPKDTIVCKGFFGIMKYGFKAMRGDCPEIEPLEINPSDYEEIWLGTPVWAGRPATPINTFLRDYQVADKVTQIFTTSKSGDDKSCRKLLQEKLPNVTKTETLLDYSKRK